MSHSDGPSACWWVDFILCESLEKFPNRILNYLHIVQWAEASIVRDTLSKEHLQFPESTKEKVWKMELYNKPIHKAVPLPFFPFFQPSSFPRS